MEIPLSPYTLSDLLKKLKSFTGSGSKSMIHVVSANPENMVLAFKDSKFKHVYDTCEVVIVDGVGVFVAAKLAGLGVHRITGVDVLEHIVGFYNERSEANERKYRVLLVGGGPGVADKVCQTLSKQYQDLVFETYELPKIDIKNTYQPDVKFAKFVYEFKPDIIFMALGSPKQEIFIETHRALFPGTVCIGVGGAFDMLAGLTRAPKLARKIGLEWLWRLMQEPWRARRQLALLRFIYLLLLGKIRFLTKVTKT